MATVCQPGQLLVRRKAYTRKAYTNKKGVHVKATHVPSSVYCIKDRGTPGKRSRGSKGGVFAGSKRWITRTGKLGGAGYLKKTDAARHALLDACVKKYGYRSCLGSIIVLERPQSRTVTQRGLLAMDRAYVKRKYGGRGAFGPRKRKSARKSATKRHSARKSATKRRSARKSKSKRA